MSRNFRIALAASIILCLATAGWGRYQKPTTPAPGSADRKAIMDALRPTFEKEIGKPIIFVVKTLRIAKNWAYWAGEPMRAPGKPVDWKKTKFKEEFEEGVMDSLSLALLKKTGKKWKVVELAIGPTDFPVEEWLKTHKAPMSLIPRD